MATNIEKLQGMGIDLGAVRQRLGADDADDTCCDSHINEMSSHDIVRAICGWHIGDGAWWDGLKDSYDELEGLGNYAE